MEAVDSPIKAPVYTHGKYWGGTVLPYWVFLVLTALPFTGFFGLDHLLFRSPSTALLKMIVNIFTLGLWYFYDIIQAFSDKEFVKEYGLSKPAFGPAGLAMDYFAGVQGADSLPKSPSGVGSILAYIAFLFLSFLPFGFSNFVAGDSTGGVIKFLLTLTPNLLILLFIPYFIVTGYYEIYEGVFTPNTLFEQGTYHPWPISWFGGKRGVAPNLMQPSALAGKEDEIKNAPGIFAKIFKPLAGWITGFFSKVLPIQEIVDTKCAIEPPVRQAADAAMKAGKAAKALADTVPAVASKISGTLATFTDPEKLKAAALAAPSAAAVSALQKVQGGGAAMSGIGSLDAFLVGGALLLATSGLAVAILRNFNYSKQISSNELSRKERHDAPPDPRRV